MVILDVVTSNWFGVIMKMANGVHGKLIIKQQYPLAERMNCQIVKYYVLSVTERLDLTDDIS